MMQDRELERLVETMKSGHNQPPPTPRDRMWQRIEAARREAAGIDTAGQETAAPRTAWRPRQRFWTTAAAMAAVLVLGVAIGRWTGAPAPGTGPDPVQQTVAQLEPAPPDGAFRHGTANLLYVKAAGDLFDRADVLLTDFKITPCAEQDLQAVPDWAGGMLLQTRLLLNTSVAEDPALRDLLLDLELVLAQIAGLNPNNCSRDAAWIRDALDQQSTIDRLRLLRPQDNRHGV